MSQSNGNSDELSNSSKRSLTATSSDSHRSAATTNTPPTSGSYDDTPCEMAPSVKEYLKDKFNYEVVSYLTAGSTCAVFKLTDAKGNYLAAKVLDRSKLSQMVLNTLLPSELSIVREVRHPNIIRVENVFSLPGYSVIISEFASDGDLISFIERSSQPSVFHAKQWFTQMLHACVYLHGKGIAHRDIKADNILLCGPNIAKLADFGYAVRCLDSKGEPILSTNFCGTLEYKGPEALLCTRAYNPLIADLFSLGVLLYVLITHEFPFGSGTEIRSSAGLATHYGHVTSKKWKPTGAIVGDERLYALLLQLLNPDTRERITAKQALASPWILSSTI